MRIVRKLTLATVVIAVAAVVVVPGAQAAEHWGVLGSFGVAPGDPEPLSAPAGVAVNESTQDVYVVDRGHDRVEWFSASGSYLGKFDGSGSFEVEGKKETGAAAPTGALSSPDGIAVDNDPSSPSFGDVYVIDEGNKAVDKFTATGAYISQLTGTCPTPGGCPTTQITKFVEIYGVAVDPNGTVWVEAGEPEPSGHPAIYDYTNGQPNTYLAGRTSQVEGLAGHGLAVDAEDDLYVVHRGALEVAKLNSAGEPLGGEPGEQLGGGGASGVAVDPSSNDVDVDVGGSIAVINPEETLVESFAGGILNKAGSLALDPAAGPSGYAYVVEPADNDVLIFEYSATVKEPPSAPTTSPATEVTGSTAKLNGEVNPEGTAGGVGYSFSYIPGAGTSCTETGSFSSPLNNGAANPTGSVAVPVSTTLTGLEPGVEYVFCLVADRFGAMVGSQQSFETSPAAPEIISQSATNITEGAGQFSAVINPNHSKKETTYLFEYSTEGSTSGNTLEGSIQTAVGETPIPAEEYGPRTVTSPVVELEPVYTAYYYRIVATNETGSTPGPVQLYVKIPLVRNESASEITLTSARLKAQIYPNFQRTHYAFEYVPSPETLEEGHGKTAPGVTELEPNETRLEPEEWPHGSAPISGLTEKTPYEFRVVAVNSSTQNPANPGKGAPAIGPPAYFTTERLPFVSTGAAENIGSVSATLSGVVTPFKQASRYYFQYITEAGYQAALAEGAPDPYAEGETTETLTLPASPEASQIGPVSATGLLPETVYHYRLDAKNQFGVSYGTARTFTTTAKTLPETTTGPANSITQTTATLTGTITTNGLETSYGFEIATSPGDYGPATGLGTASGTATQPISETLTELQPAATYYYRTTATNINATIHGTEQTFTTPPQPNPLTTPTPPPLLTTIPPFTFPETQPQTPPKKPTKAQLLKKALHNCKKHHNKTQRQHCEQTAKKKYGPTKHTHHTKT